MLTNGTCTCRFQRSYPWPSPALGVNAARRVVCEAQRSGFGADEERQGGAGPARKKVSALAVCRGPASVLT